MVVRVRIERTWNVPDKPSQLGVINEIRSNAILYGNHYPFTNPDRFLKIIVVAFRNINPVGLARTYQRMSGNKKRTLGDYEKVLL